MSGQALSPRRSSPPDGSRLCCFCGLCCQGTLHNCAKVYQGDLETVLRLDLPVSHGEHGPVFTLPCPRLEENRCSVYKDRPKACRIYRCKLLRRYLEGEIDLETGQAMVSRAKALISSARERMRFEAGGLSIWQQVKSYFSGGVPESGSAMAGDTFLMDLAELSALCRRHFKNRDEAQRVMAR